MKVKLTFILVLNAVFIWNEVNCYDPFEELAKYLKSIETEYKAAENSSDACAVYRTNADAYAKKFKTFLEEYNNSNNNLTCQKFRELDGSAWEGHYLMKVYMDDVARQEIALNNTKFQRVHKNIILQKHLDLIHHHILFFLRSWSRNILETRKASALNKVSVDMSQVKDRYTEALLMLAESEEPKFKKYEVYLIYFYLKVKRIVQNSDFHNDQFIYDEFQKLVNLYVTEPNSLSIGSEPKRMFGFLRPKSRTPSPNGSRTSTPKSSPTNSPTSSPNNSPVSTPASSPKSPSKIAKISKNIGKNIRKKLTPGFMRKKDDITKYIEAKLKEIKKGLSSDDKESKYNEVATAFINLYYNVFEDVPDKFDITKIEEQYLKFLNAYGRSNARDIKYHMVSDGYGTLSQVFGPGKKKKFKF